MDCSKPRIRFEPPRRRRNGPQRSRSQEGIGGTVTTPRSPPSSSAYKQSRTKRRKNRDESLDSPLPSLRAGSQWRGATTIALTPVATPADGGSQEWDDIPDPIRLRSYAKNRNSKMKEQTHARWTALIPDLIVALKNWSALGKRNADTTPVFQDPPCSADCHGHRLHRVVCIDLTGFELQLLASCPNHTIASSLIQKGYWPSSPMRPPRAFSIDLLGHYLSLYDACATPNDAFCEALIHEHAERGFYYLSADEKGGSPFQDPWRRSFSSAAFWFDICRQAWELELRAFTETSPAQSERPGSHGDTVYSPADDRPLLDSGSVIADRASANLRGRCPACFALDSWGRPADSGSDVLVALDGNRQLKRLRRTGSSSCSHQAQLFLSRSKVQAMREAMITAKEGAGVPPTRPFPRLDSEVVERCRRSFKVANEDANIVSDQLFDITGVLIMVCCHDVPLFACDITTPGERQEYGLALIHALIEELPRNATIGVLYDIGCQVDTSCDTYRYLGDARPRITFACSVLHAYGHEWACQVLYHPRRRSGFGLTDGEGSERVWSRTRRLIPILRRASVERRSFVLERKFENCGKSMKSSLGNWFKRKYRLIRIHRISARAEIEASGLTEHELREQLVLQRAEPIPQKPDSSKELRRKLELFKRMQSELENVGEAIKDTMQAMSQEFGLPRSAAIFIRLNERQEELQRYGRSLFADMRLDGSYFPQLSGVLVQFMHYLLLARQEKINIRSRVVEHLWELSRLQRARGGGHDPIGTKVRDAILKGWAPRWRSTKAAVERYNSYVEILEQSPHPGISVPLPPKLDIADLQNPSEDHPLWQDVWWPAEAAPPLWVTSQKVRRGITAILLLDRCDEEEKRLIMESDNMARWWVEEMIALLQALNHAPDLASRHVLERQIREHDWLQYRWRCPPLSAVRWKNIRERVPTSRSEAQDEERDDLDPIILQWSEPATVDDWDHEGDNDSPASSVSDPYDRAMADLDAVVEELGAVVIDRRDLEHESEVDDIDALSDQPND